MAQLRRAEVERFAGGQTEELQRSTEQLASVVAALAIDPLLRDPAVAAPMLDELLEANEAFTAT